MVCALMMMPFQDFALFNGSEAVLPEKSIIILKALRVHMAHTAAEALRAVRP
jgi:hypothetical protein